MPALDGLKADKPNLKIASLLHFSLLIMDTGDKIQKQNSSWSFDEIDVHDFDSHIEKSVPGYLESHSIGLWLSDFFLKENSCVYDIGSSSGTFLGKLRSRHLNKNCSYNGLENVENMYKQSALSFPEIKFHNTDALSFDYEESAFITSFYTIQFIPTKVRQALVNTIYNSLEWGGAFLMFEKVRP